MLQAAKKISYMLDEYLYYYIQRHESITKKFNIKRFDSMEAFDERTEFFRQKGDMKNMHNTLLKKHRTLKQVLEKINKLELTDEEKRVVGKYENEFEKLGKMLNLQ